MRIGAHVSTAGGPVTCLERAEAIGAEAAQIFLTPPQQ
jgi:endonuclease IV